MSTPKAKLEWPLCSKNDYVLKIWGATAPKPPYYAYSHTLRKIAMQAWWACSMQNVTLTFGWELDKPGSLGSVRYHQSYQQLTDTWPWLNLEEVIRQHFWCRSACGSRHSATSTWLLFKSALVVVDWHVPVKLLVGVMGAAKHSFSILDFAAEVWCCCCAFCLRFWAPHFISTPIYMLHLFVFSC